MARRFWVITIILALLSGEVHAQTTGTVGVTVFPAGSAATNVGTLGGALSGTLPSPGMATGAAATNIGALGGVLSGTLPSPSMTAGAAATNLGSAGGDLTGTYPSPTAKGMTRVICSIRSANLNVVTDQACTPPASITKFTVTSILVTNASTSLTTVAGGVYPAVSKGGVPLVAAGQVYTALTAANIILTMTLAGTVAAVPYTSAVFLSLTLGQGSAATADIYVIGIDLT